jgi:hypothetical protein
MYIAARFRVKETVIQDIRIICWHRYIDIAKRGDTSGFAKFPEASPV